MLIYALNRCWLSVIRFKDFQELLIDFELVWETIPIFNVSVVRFVSFVVFIYLPWSFWSNQLYHRIRRVDEVYLVAVGSGGGLAVRLALKLKLGSVVLRRRRLAFAVLRSKQTSSTSCCNACSLFWCLPYSYSRSCCGLCYDPCRQACCGFRHFRAWIVRPTCVLTCETSWFGILNT